MSDKYQFTKADEVREFLGDEIYNAVFSGDTDDEVMKNGVVVGDDNLPTLCYAKPESIDEVCRIILANASIRCAMNGTELTTCIKNEAGRAAQLGILGIGLSMLLELISPKGKSEMNKSDFVLIEYERTPINPDDDVKTCVAKVRANADNCHRHYAGKYTKHKCRNKEMLIGKFESEGITVAELSENEHYIAGMLDMLNNGLDIDDL